MIYIRINVFSLKARTLLKFKMKYANVQDYSLDNQILFVFLFMYEGV